MQETELLGLLGQTCDLVVANSYDVERLYESWWTGQTPQAMSVSIIEKWDPPREYVLDEIVESGVIANDLRGNFFIPHGQWISLENGRVRVEKLIGWADPYFLWRRGKGLLTSPSTRNFRIYIPYSEQIQEIYRDIGDELDLKSIPFTSKIRRHSTGHADQCVLYVGMAEFEAVLNLCAARCSKSDFEACPPPLTRFQSGCGWCPDTETGESFGYRCCVEISRAAYSRTRPTSLPQWYDLGLPNLDFLAAQDV